MQQIVVQVAGPAVQHDVLVDLAIVVAPEAMPEQAQVPARVPARVADPGAQKDEAPVEVVAVERTARQAADSISQRSSGVTRSSASTISTQSFRNGRLSSAQFFWREYDSNACCTTCAPCSRAISTRPIVRERVDDEHLVGPGQAVQAGGQVELLVERRHQHRDPHAQLRRALSRVWRTAIGVVAPLELLSPRACAACGQRSRRLRASRATRQWPRPWTSARPARSTAPRRRRPRGRQEYPPPRPARPWPALRPAAGRTTRTTSDRPAAAPAG